MPRPIRQRESYDADAARLMNLSQAINLDAAADPKWKQEVRGRIYDLCGKLNEETRRRAAQVPSKKKN